MSSISSIPTWGWVDIVFTILVVIGVWGESEKALNLLIPYGPYLLSQIESKRQKLKKKFGFVLIVGLCGELFCLPFSLWDSAQKNLEATLIKSENIKLQAKVEELRNANLELAIRQNPRVITTAQRENFLNIVKDWAKGPVNVYAGLAPDSEVDNYAWHILSLLKDAGYGNANMPGIIKQGAVVNWTLEYPYPTNMPISQEPLFIVMYSTNTEQIVWPGIQLEINKRLDGGTNIIAHYSTNDVRAVPALVDDAFTKIGIRCLFFGTTNALKPGDWGVFVPPKRF